MLTVAQMGQWDMLHVVIHFLIIFLLLLNVGICLKRPNIILIVADDLGKRDSFLAPTGAQGVTMLTSCSQSAFSQPSVSHIIVIIPSEP